MNYVYICVMVFLLVLYATSHWIHIQDFGIVIGNKLSYHCALAIGCCQTIGTRYLLMVVMLSVMVFCFRVNADWTWTLLLVECEYCQCSTGPLGPQKYWMPSQILSNACVSMGDAVIELVSGSSIIKRKRNYVLSIGTGSSHLYDHATLTAHPYQTLLWLC